MRFLNRQKSSDQLRRFTRLHDLDIFGSSLDLLNTFIVCYCILKDFLSVNTVLLGICASPHVGKTLEKLGIGLILPNQQGRHHWAVGYRQGSLCQLPGIRLQPDGRIHCSGNDIGCWHIGSLG